MNIYWKSLTLTLSLIGIFRVSHARRSKVITVTNENWKQMLEGEWVIKFFAPWCPACKSMAADYKEFADWSDDLNIQVAEVNINDQAGLSGRFIVTALPTIYHAKNGEFRRYTGQRDANSLHKYIQEKLWWGVEPVAWYRHPDSILMSMMAGLFQTSVLIKNFHETLTENYGFSSTMSYIIFGILTIATGLLLGLILVFIIDCVSPPKPAGKLPHSVDKGQKKEEEAAGESTEEEDEEGEDRESSGRESVSGDEKEDRSKEGSSEEEEGRGSQASSKSSSRTSQDWEQVQGEEAEEAEQALDIERDIPDGKEEGQGEVRRRNITKPEDDDKD